MVMLRLQYYCTFMHTSRRIGYLGLTNLSRSQDSSAASAYKNVRYERSDSPRDSLRYLVLCATNCPT